MTGLIYVAIVAMWAAVLIPMWLRRHDAEQHDLGRRHQEAMEVLGGTPEGSALSTRSRAVRRRRAILAGLAVALVTAVGAFALGLVGAWLPALAAVALAAFIGGRVLLARMGEARAAEEAARAHRRARVRTREARPARATPRPSADPARVRTSTPATGSRRASSAAWEQVFDQTA